MRKALITTYSQVFNITWDYTPKWCYLFGSAQAWQPYQDNNRNPEVFGPYSNGVWYGHGFCIQRKVSELYGVIYRSLEIQFAISSRGTIQSAVVIDQHAGVVNLESFGNERDN